MAAIVQVENACKPARQGVLLSLQEVMRYVYCARMVYSYGDVTQFERGVATVANTAWGLTLN